MFPCPAAELPKKRPVISGDFQESMDEGDRVRANCTVYRSRPAAHLTWYINGARVSEIVWYIYQRSQSEIVWYIHKRSQSEIVWYMHQRSQGE